MKLSIGFSPCPNDTFIFDALVNHKIDTEGIQWEVVMEDVQTLNNLAKEGRLDISKISYGVLPLVLNRYLVLNSGGALGKGVGPLLIRRPLPIHEPLGYELKKLKPVSEMIIAVPGINTTANLLFSMAYPLAKNKQYLVFHEIEDAILSGKVDAGVIIHENRFTYQEKGLEKISDLGEFWVTATQSPIPLGGIVIKRSLDNSIHHQIDRFIRKSLTLAFNNFPLLTDYVQQHSQEMDESVMRKHIQLYVNNYSMGLGEDGKKSVKKLLEIYQQINASEKIRTDDIFLQ